MSRINYNPSAVQKITVYEPVCMTVADELSHQIWLENLRGKERERSSHSSRWRRATVHCGNGRWDSKVFRSGVFFDNMEEALNYLKDVMVPEYSKKVEAGVYTALAGKTKPGFSEFHRYLGLDPNYADGDHFWNSYFDYVIYGKVDTRNSYAYKKKQYTWKQVEAFALRVEKKTLYVPAT